MPRNNQGLEGADDLLDALDRLSNLKLPDEIVIDVEIEVELDEDTGATDDE